MRDDEQEVSGVAVDDEKPKLAATYNIDRRAAAAMARTLPLEHGERGVIIAENVFLNGETIRLDGALRFTPREPNSTLDTPAQLI